MAADNVFSYIFLSRKVHFTKDHIHYSSVSGIPIVGVQAPGISIYVFFLLVNHEFRKVYMEENRKLALHYGIFKTLKFSVLPIDMFVSGF